MHFYDEHRNPIARPTQLCVGHLFAIGVLDARRGTASRPLVGLFIEDDDNYFLKTTFDATWLRDLVLTAAQSAVAVLDDSQLEAIVRTLRTPPTSDTP